MDGRHGAKQQGREWAKGGVGRRNITSLLLLQSMKTSEQPCSGGLAHGDAAAAAAAAAAPPHASAVKFHALASDAAPAAVKLGTHAACRPGGSGLGWLTQPRVANACAAVS